MKSSSSSLANTRCSFEVEPQTLSEGQLSQAREVAQNQEPTEASTTLFSQREPVGDARERGMQMAQNTEQAEKMELHVCTQHKDHKPCNCICTN